MNKGETTKPCEGCGESGVRTAGKVCWRCQRLLDEARAARARQEADAEVRIYDMPATFPWYHAPAVRPTRAELRRLEDQLRDVMKRLVHSVGTPALGTEVYHPDRAKLFTFPKGRRLEYSSYYDRQMLFKPETAQAFDELDTHIQTALEAAYLEGKRDGANLLLQLADGDITIGDFNKRVG